MFNQDVGQITPPTDGTAFQIELPISKKHKSYCNRVKTQQYNCRNENDGLIKTLAALARARDSKSILQITYFKFGM